MTSSDDRPDAFLTAVSVLDSLIRAGMGHVVIAPGSRSAPLAYALAAAAEAGVLRVHVRIDERTAGFTALGLAKATGRPVAVVTTSGTAVGELLPAVMEAHHAEVPVAVLSADRPPRLRGSGANQTTVQPGIFGTHVRAAVDLTAYPEESPGPQTAGFMDCLAALTGRDPLDWDRPSPRPRGPVQINCAFDEPLTPSARMRETLRAWADGLQGLRAPADPVLEDPTVQQVLADQPASTSAPRRTVVVAGDGAGTIARDFARARGLPLLAEPSSGARSGPEVLSAYRVLLGSPELGGAIERVVLFGRPTLSRPITRLLADPGIDSVIYLPRPVAWADPRRRTERPVRTLAEAADFAGTGPKSWLESWRAADARVRAGIADLLADRGATGLATAGEVWQACARDGAALVSGSSNVVRDLDLMPAPERTLPGTYSNRGLAGIDGTLATATGISLGLGTVEEAAPVRLLVGDLTLLHDVGSLNLGPGEQAPRLQVVVFNDVGGGIFTTLEHGQVAQEAGWSDAVERFFATPHTVDLGSLVRAYGHRYVLTEDVDALRAALRAPGEGIEVIEVRGHRSDLRDLHEAVARLV